MGEPEESGLFGLTQSAQQAREAAVDAVAEHLVECAQVSATIVVDGNADPIIAELLAAGWKWDTRPAESIAGKRIRYLRPPSTEEIDHG